MSAKPKLTGLGDMFKETDARVERLSPYLIERGWCVFPTLTFPAIARLDKIKQAGDDRALDSTLMVLARQHAAEVINTVSKAFPRRAAILADAFKAHEERRYALSVPVFLCQMDGVCHDIVGAFLFTTRKGKKLQKVLADMPAGSIVTLMLLPVRAGKRFVRSQALHRDNILHGSDTKYATEMNSLKCIMLLEYLAHWLKHNKESVERRKAFLAELQAAIDRAKVGKRELPCLSER